MIPFDPVQGLIMVQAQVEGPSATVDARLALDTGATDTLIGRTILVAAGYAPDASTATVPITFGGGSSVAPVVPVIRFKALGQERVGLEVVAFDLPANAGIDGVLGLDFLRGFDLIISFRHGVVVLE